MPNPVGSYRGLWMLTWVLQVMPLFFIVSGSVNADAWNRHHVKEGGSQRCVREASSGSVHCVRWRCWWPSCAVAEAVGRALNGQPFITRHLVILVPLWTLGLLMAYAPATAMPWTGLGAVSETTTTVWLGSIVVLSDLVRFRAGSGPGRRGPDRLHHRGLAGGLPAWVGSTGVRWHRGAEATRGHRASSGLGWFRRSR
jgi:hypothetical protein